MKLSRKGKKMNFMDKSKNVISGDSKFAIVEGYKIARTNLVFSLSAAESNVVAFTSWSKGEGKSTATANLAISFSKMDKKVLLIDADLRRPNLHNLMKLQNTAGLSEVIGKFKSFDEVINRDVLPYLDVLTSGSIPPNPSELLASQNFSAMLEVLRKDYDYIILDTPPVGVVADALILKDLVAGYVVVVREKFTTHGDIEKALQSIRLADSKVLGFLKVGCAASERKYSKGQYGYYKYY
ncbi:MAG: CpsD/CapB family tyrosine-protein kinase [Oscillospiraceae bacterium]|nr:CpsD/CapB family tyrosine-protein kinase [Oscillospiraceae bacterium]